MINITCSSDRVALVTGSTRGIGKGVAIELAKEGINLAINGRSTGETAEKTVGACREQGVRAEFFAADISLHSSRKEMIDSIRDEFGRLDILVNNAGVAPKERVDILEASRDSYDRVMTINLKGPYFLTQLASKWMIEQKHKHEERDYQIINISSVSAFASSPERGQYCMSKAGISMLTKLYAHRLAEHGITVFEIRPGIILTDMTKPVKDKYDEMINKDDFLPLDRWGKPEDVGRAVTGIVNGHFPYSTGEVFHVDGGFHLDRL